MIGTKREKMIADVFCTPDEDRPVLSRHLDDCIIDHYNKEYLRQIFIQNGFYDALKKARSEGRSEPPYPLLGEEIIKEVSRRYSAFAAHFSAVRI